MTDCNTCRRCLAPLPTENTMTTQTHTVSTDALATLGTHPLPDNAGRDAIHLAVEPVTAGEHLYAGEHVRLVDGKAVRSADEGVGIVDPFITGHVNPDERFWLVVLPRTITSLRHVWEHPAFGASPPVAVTDAKAASVAWMRAWAMEHVSDDYYGEDGGKKSEESAYAFAIWAGENTRIGPYESARDFIDNEWWGHWETITGKPGQRGEYFSCAC